MEMKIKDIRITNLLTKININKKVDMTQNKTTPFVVMDEGKSMLISNKELRDLIPSEENRLGITEHSASIEKRAKNRQRKLRISMKKHGFLKEYPILITEDLRICNGHNRWQVACDLGLDAWVQFTEIEDVATHAKAQNSATPWNINDFVTAKANKGYKEAKIVKYMSERYKLSVSTTIQLLTKKRLNSSSAESMIIDQEVNIVDYPWAEKIAQQVHELCLILNTHVQGQKVQQALIKCMEAPEQNNKVYDHERMKTKLEYQYGKLVPVTTIKDYLRQFQDIYNHKCQHKDKFFFT